tara:strand:- start:158 stop:781 length:624 start_codon:yes stop_codon:yes gene_type:complete
MPLPHYTQISNVGQPGGPGTLPDEVVYLNLFEVTFVLPTILQAQGRDPLLLLENATKISLSNLTNFDVADATQRYKYSTRKFLTTPSKTDGELQIPFQVNVNQAGSMEVWNTLKSWYDLVFNSQNGALHYKSDIIGTIIVNQHDKKGVVLRRVTFQNCQLKSLTGYDMDWSSNTIVENVEGSFIYDYFIDEYLDNNFTITPPIISGY